MTQAAPLERLRKRADFLAAAKGFACARGAVLAQARDRRDGTAAIRVGFTATRRIGGAVVRNRAKRRLREAARQMAPALGRPGCDYVLIARGGIARRPWARLLDDVKSALIRLAADLGASQSVVQPGVPGGEASAPFLDTRPGSQANPRPDPRPNSRH
jgi:ribonuclease P protein component